MNSLDTDMLVYAANTATPEHAKALNVVNAMLARDAELIRGRLRCPGGATTPTRNAPKPKPQGAKSIAPT